MSEEKKVTMVELKIKVPVNEFLKLVADTLNDDRSLIIYGADGIKTTPEDVIDIIQDKMSNFIDQNFIDSN